VGPRAGLEAVGRLFVVLTTNKTITYFYRPISPTNPSSATSWFRTYNFATCFECVRNVVSCCDGDK
jgi:hypothetical protein